MTADPKHLMPGMARFRRWLALSAMSAVATLAAVLTWSDAYLPASLPAEDARLAAISQRAEELQAFVRHIRKASFSAMPEADVPFGGYIGRARLIEPGARLKLGALGNSGAVLQIVSARRIDPSVSLASASTGTIELMLVTGRLEGAGDVPLMRFLVAVTPDKVDDGLPPGRLPQARLPRHQHQSL